MVDDLIGDQKQALRRSFNTRLDLVRACPDRLKGDLGKPAPNPIVSKTIRSEIRPNWFSSSAKLFEEPPEIGFKGFFRAKNQFSEHVGSFG